MAELAKRDYPQDVIDAVAGHADFLGVPRETGMAKTLFAVDELSGFVAACALVRPTGIEGMKPKSVRKKLKQPSFAAEVDRDEIERGIEELGVDETEHIALVIDGARGRRRRARALSLARTASAMKRGWKILHRRRGPGGPARRSTRSSSTARPSRPRSTPAAARSSASPAATCR